MLCTTAVAEGEARPLEILSFQGDTSVMVVIVLCFGVVFWCCLQLMYGFIFKLSLGN